MSLNGDEKRRWKVWLSLSTPPPSLQVGTATKCAPGPTWMGMDWGKGLISAFFFCNHARTMRCTATLAFSPEGHTDAHQPKLGRNTSDSFRPDPLPATREKGDEHCIRMPHVYSDRTPAEWRLCEKWLNIPSSGSWYFRPPKDHLMKTLMNSNLNEQLCALKWILVLTPPYIATAISFIVWIDPGTKLLYTSCDFVKKKKSYNWTDN